MHLTKTLGTAMGDRAPTWWIEWSPAEVLGSGGLVRITRWWYGIHPVERLAYRTDRTGD